MEWIKKNFVYIILIVTVILVVYLVFLKKKPNPEFNNTSESANTGTGTTDSLTRARNLYSTNQKVKSYADWAVNQTWLRDKAASNKISVWDQAYLDAAWMYDNGYLNK